MIFLILGFTQLKSDVKGVLITTPFRMFVLHKFLKITKNYILVAQSFRNSANSFSCDHKDGRNPVGEVEEERTNHFSALRTD
jgi:hypothetical protein